MFVFQAHIATVHVVERAFACSVCQYRFKTLKMLQTHERQHAPEELEFIRPLRCYSVDAAKMFDRAHFVFIDGDHKYEAVKSDIAAWSKKPA